MKFASCLLLLLIFSCKNALVPVDEENVNIDNGAVTDLSRSINTKEGDSVAMTKGDEISIVQFGAKGDAVQRNDFTISGNSLSVNDDIFTKIDVGKIYSVARAGEKGEHLVGKFVKFVNSRTMVLDKKAVLNVQNELGSFGTDNINTIQKAFDYVIKKNVALYIPEGVYLIGDRNPVTNETAVRINMKRPNQNLVVRGAGKNKTIFRELDGKTQRFGRYTKMFYHYLKNSPDIGDIMLSDLAFDKNGRSLTLEPKTRYEWEQAHCFAWAMSNKESSPKRINKIVLNNLEIIDKVGAGINFSSGPTKVTSFYATNITEKDFGGNDGVGVAYGQRGDLEISCFSQDIKIDNCELHYIQIEPVRSFSSDAQNLRYCKITNSTIHNIEYTESDNKEPQYSRLEIDNVISERFVGRSISFLVENSDIKTPDLINSVDGIIINSRIRLPFDQSTNTVTPVNCGHLRTLGEINNLVKFQNCSFEIESTDSNILPIGFALRASGKVKSLSMNKVIVENCTFDKRLQYSIDAYANGAWVLKDNTFAGRDQAVSVGGYRDFVSEVTLENNDYSALQPNKAMIRINNNNGLWKLQLDKSLIANNPTFIMKKGSKGNLQRQIIDN